VPDRRSMLACDHDRLQFKADQERCPAWDCPSPAKTLIFKKGSVLASAVTRTASYHTAKARTGAMRDADGPNLRLTIERGAGVEALRPSLTRNVHVDDARSNHVSSSCGHHHSANVIFAALMT
jgi:hypothetical protein